jgi:hypothetical protein
MTYPTQYHLVTVVADPFVGGLAREDTLTLRAGNAREVESSQGRRKVSWLPRLFITLLSSATMLALVGTASPAVATVASAGTAKPNANRASSSCSTAGLVVWLDTNGDAAAGNILYRLEFTNLSLHSCTLVGFPGVSAVNFHGRQLGSPAVHNNAIPSDAVTLVSGATGFAELHIAVAGIFPSASCRPTTAVGLRVYPPGGTEPKVVPFPLPACSLGGPAFLQVEALQHG